MNKKINQFGRSMVEMLGVLAIIGVLSVGAIAGYSKAMNKYKMNKQTEQIDTILSAISRYKLELRKFNKSTDDKNYNLIPFLKKLREIPETMYVKNNEEKIQDAFKTQYTIYHHSTGKMYVGLRGFVSNSSDGVETCKNLYTIAKNWHNEVSFIEIVSYKSSTEHREGFLYGDYECSTDSSKKCLSTATVKDIDDACRVFKKDNNNYSILFVFWDAE